MVMQNLNYAAAADVVLAEELYDKAVQRCAWQRRNKQRKLVRSRVHIAGIWVLILTGPLTKRVTLGKQVA